MITSTSLAPLRLLIVAIAGAVAPTLAVSQEGHGIVRQSITWRPGTGGPTRVTEQVSGTNQLLQAVHAVSERVVWASGHRGVVLRTLDGGTTWKRLPVPDSDSLEFRDVHAASANTAWILAAGPGARSRIYRTTNGGASWDLQFRNADTAAFYDCFTMLDARRGVAYSDASHGRTNILRTTNGGVNWTLVKQGDVPAPLPAEGAFASSGQCVVQSGPNTVLIATGAPGARMLRSTDAGARWTTSETPFVRAAVSGTTGMAFRDVSRSGGRGMAVAADINRLRLDTSSAALGVTSDGGRTWTLRLRPPLPGALSAVTLVGGANGKIAVVAGFGGAFATDDDGFSWHVINGSLYTGATSAGRTAWITGGGGRITRLDWEK
ncbi:MAG TPA: hypothetical protein VE869_09015 [Gemmatimonas sp.]|nr:hypothetical protein [Gemmatimonas sp.]